MTDEPLATSEQLSSPQLSNAQAIRNISELNEARLRALNFMDNEPLATSKQLSNPQLSNAQAMRNISALAELNEARLRDKKRQLQFALQTSFPPPPFIQMPPPIPMPVMGPQHGKCFRYRLQQGWPNHCPGAKKCPSRLFHVPSKLFYENCVL